MGCVKSSNANDEEDAPNRVRKPRPWRYEGEISLDELRDMRNIFWRNVPRFGGRADIWQALRTAAESDLPYAQDIINNNRIRLENADMTICYDEEGYRYELPLYVLSEPSNMIGLPRADTVRRPSMMERIRRRM